MSSAKRYDISEFGGGMVEVEEGAWYHSDDYDALAAECQGLRERARTAEREAAQALRTLKGLEKVAKVVDANSDEVCGENNALRADNKRLREALAAVAKADWECAHDATDYEVSDLKGDCIFRMRRIARDALAGSKEGGL